MSSNRVRLRWAQRPRVRALAPARRCSPRQRRVMGAAIVLVVIALIVAVVALTFAVRSAPAPDDDERADVQAAAASAVTSVMTLENGAPTDPAATRRQLADPLLARFDATGADIALPGVVAASATMSVTVVGMAVSEYRPDRARLLAFLDQTVSVPTAPGQPPASTTPDGAPTEAGHTPSERWLVMSKVNGTWLLADLQQVGDLTR